MKTTLIFLVLLLALSFNEGYSQTTNSPSFGYVQQPQLGDYVYFKLGGYVCIGLIGTIDYSEKNPRYFVKFSIMYCVGNYYTCPPLFNTIWLKRHQFVIANGRG